MTKIQNIFDNTLRLEHFGDDLLESMSFGQASATHIIESKIANYEIINEMIQL
jgi:hypothetical protein